MYIAFMQNPSQKVVQKLAAEVWKKLPQVAKNSGKEEWDKYVSQIDIAELAKRLC